MGPQRKGRPGGGHRRLLCRGPGPGHHEARRASTSPPTRSSPPPIPGSAAGWCWSPPTIRRCTPPRTSRITATTPLPPRCRCSNPPIRGGQGDAQGGLRPERGARYPGHAPDHHPGRPMSKGWSPVAKRRSPDAVCGINKIPGKLVMLPAMARKRRVVVEERMAEMPGAGGDRSPSTGSKPATPGGASSPPVSPISMSRRPFPEAAVLKLGMCWPLPEQKIRDFAAIGR